MKERARELGLSDSEVARRLNVSQSRYANYANDTAEPDLTTMSRICRVLNTSPDEVLGFRQSAADTPEALLMARLTAAASSMDLGRLRTAVALMDTLAGMPNA